MFIKFDLCKALDSISFPPSLAVSISKHRLKNWKWVNECVCGWVDVLIKDVCQEFWPLPTALYWRKVTCQGGNKNLVVNVQMVPNHRRLLIIDDKSLPHKQQRAFTRLLIFKIKFSSEPPSRWLAGSAEMTPIIGNARRVRGEVMLTIELVD